jgi:hypothetical protein
VVYEVLREIRSSSTTYTSIEFLYARVKHEDTQYDCWGEGEHATLRSTTSSSHRVDEGYIHSTPEQAEGADRTEACATPSLSCYKTGPPAPSPPGRPMCYSGHGNGPREDKCDKGRVCNKVYLSDYL